MRSVPATLIARGLQRHADRDRRRAVDQVRHAPGKLVSSFGRQAEVRTDEVPRHHLEAVVKRAAQCRCQPVARRAVVARPNEHDHALVRAIEQASEDLRADKAGGPSDEHVAEHGGLMPARHPNANARQGQTRRSGRRSGRAAYTCAS
jgi:hypothetical protein